MRVLIVEDEKKVAKFIQQGLEEEHYAVDVAYDGEKGLQMADAENYDLIILDVMLPKKNGFDVCRDLRQRGITTPVIIIVTTVVNTFDGLSAAQKLPAPSARSYTAAASR